MNPVQPIYTEVNNCRDCYKCVRWCPVKAIKVEKDSASIIKEQCVFCGRCTLICPAGAKKVRNDLSKAQDMVLQNENTIASLAPSYVTEFPGVTPEQMVAAIKMLGFAHVSETALGAELVSSQCRELLAQAKLPFYISSACPSVVELIQKYYPSYSKYITPLLSPMGAHGQWLKTKSDSKIVFFSPCIAKKTETDRPACAVDISLTFKDLREWFDNYDIDPLKLEVSEESSFYPAKAGNASMYPVDGGMINSIKSGTGHTDYAFMSFSGIGNIKKVLFELEQLKTEKPLFLELLSCEGGCINGPGSSISQSMAQKRYNLLNQKSTSTNLPSSAFSLDIRYAYNGEKDDSRKTYSESEITEALYNIGKQSKADQLDCGGCGYNSCRDFAMAYLDKKAEQTMCVSYMRRIANDKATALLQKMPSGVMMVNENLKIIESNRNFARFMGPEFESLYDLNPGLAGADIRKLFTFHKLFSAMLQSGEESIERDIRENGRLLHVSIFTIQKHKVVCGLFRDMYAPEVRRDEVIKRTRKVIKENLQTVQQIAFLLGENASRTESILNTIVESYNAESDE